MDMITEPPPDAMPHSSEPGGPQFVVGVKQLKKALREGRARRVFLAEDADPRITQEAAELCRLGNVPVSWVPSMEGLGKACGISVGAAAAAEVDS